MSEPVTLSELVKKLTSPSAEPITNGVFTLLVLNLTEYGSSPLELQKMLDKRFQAVIKSSDEAKVRSCMDGITNIVCAIVDLQGQDKSLLQLNEWIYDIISRMGKYKEKIGLDPCNKIKLSIIRTRQRRLKKRTYFRDGSGSSSSDDSPRKSAVRTKSQSSSSSSSSSSSPSLSRWSSSFLQAIVIFEHWEIDDFAARLTYSESRLLSQIKFRELKNQAWQKSGKEERAPNVVAMVSRFNCVSYWIAENLCRIDNLDDRVNNIIGLIELAGKLYDRNNFNGLMEVIGALNNIAIQRMKSTWEIVMQKSRSRWEFLNDLMESANNYKKYRDALAECSLPCVPFLGVFLRDLTFIDDGNQDFIKSKINFDKLHLMGEVFSQIKKFQSKRYSRPSRVNELDSLFLPVPEDSDDRLYEMSVIVEPRAVSVDTDGGAVAQSPAEPSVVFLTVSATGGSTEVEFPSSFTLEDLLVRVDKICSGTVLKSITFKTLASTMRLNKATFLDFVATRAQVEGRSEYRLTLNISPKIDIETSCSKCVIRVTNDQGVIKDSMISPSNLTVEGIGKAVKALWPDVRYAFFKNEEGNRVKLDKLTFTEFVGTAKIHKKVAEYRLWIKRFK